KPSDERAQRIGKFGRRGPKCWNCRKRGHRQAHCMEKKKKDTENDSEDESDDHRSENRYRRGRGKGGRETQKKSGSKKPRARRTQEKDSEDESSTEYTDIEEEAGRASEVLLSEMLHSESLNLSRARQEKLPKKKGRSQAKWCIDSGATS